MSFPPFVSKGPLHSSIRCRNRDLARLSYNPIPPQTPDLPPSGQGPAHPFSARPRHIFRLPKPRRGLRCPHQYGKGHPSGERPWRGGAFRPGNEGLTMSNPFFDKPTLNSPYECPRRHWELDGSQLVRQARGGHDIIEARQKYGAGTPRSQRHAHGQASKKLHGKYRTTGAAEAER